MKNLGLPTILPINIDTTAMVKTILLDKKNIEGKIRMVIPESIGKMKINFEISEENLKGILNE